MQAYRVETTILTDGSITLHHLPFHAGEPIEVIILAGASEVPPVDRYPLRGTPLHYEEPDKPVA